jgi:hypothetical protein
MNVMMSRIRTSAARVASVLLLASVVLFAASGTCWAWGCTGHEVVALIALNRLHTQNPAIETALNNALAGIDKNYSGRFCGDFGLPLIAYFATWADDYRSTPAGASTANWHYWDVPLAKASDTNASDFCDEGCVVQAIPQQIAVMKDTTKPLADRQHALLFILHFVGDIHQPLHIEDNGDRGGNCVPIDFLADHTSESKDNGKPTGSYSPNLHGIWDTQLVETAGQVKRSKTNPQAAQEIQDFANKLVQTHTATMNTAAGDLNVLDWANESHAAAATKAYAKLPHKDALIPAPKTLTSCYGVSDVLAQLHESASQTYVTTMGTVVKTRLSQAGARLAATLAANWPSDWK